MTDVEAALDEAGHHEPPGPRVRRPLGGDHPARPDRGRQRRRRRPAGAGGARRRRARCPPARGATTHAATPRTPRAPRSARSSRPTTRSDKGVYNNWRPAVGDEAELLTSAMRGASRGQDDVRHPVPDGAARLAARAVRRRRRAHRQPHRRAAHDPDGARRRGRTSTTSPTRTASCRAVHVTGDLENLGQGTARRPALLRDRRRRAHDPALRLVVRRQRAARQDRPRSAPGLLRRLGVGRLPGRAVHADRHHRQGDRQAPTTSAAASRAPRARPTSR